MIKAVVTDIEGTTSSLSFVKDVLFPYASSNLPAYIRRNAANPAVRCQLDLVRQDIGQQSNDENVINQLLQWIEQDKKVTPLKVLQGLIWEKGYVDGDFKGHIYDDAYATLKKWHEYGIKLYVYSSGSVYAQKLLYGHTKFGDITGLFSGFFDTNIGKKTETSSYQKIVKELKLQANEIVFLSDIEAELDAANKAGISTCWLVRDGQKALSSKHKQVINFAKIVLENVNAT